MSKYKGAFAVPTPAEVEKEAYIRWERRGRTHGCDHEDWLAAERDLTYALNYRSIVHVPLFATPAYFVGSSRPSRCRFCEEAASRTGFSPGRSPIPEFFGHSSIVSRDVCDACAQSFRDHLEGDFRRFWESLPGRIAGRADASTLSIVPFKALTWLALALLPEAELEYFPDALEWVSNPEHDDDSGLFSKLACLAYSVPLPTSLAWVSLDRRKDDDAPLPFSIFTLAASGIILQLPVPLGVHDQESDGEEIRLLRRSWTLAGVSSLGEFRKLTPGPTNPSSRGRDG